MTIELLGAVASVFLLLLAAFGCGTLIRRRLPLEIAKWEGMVLQCLWGLGVLGLLLFLVGLLRFDRRVIISIIGPAAALGCTALLVQGHTALKFPTASMARATKRLLLFTAAILLLLSLASLAEPLGNVDHIRYHLLEGKIWLQDGFVHVLPENLHTAFPATLDMHFAALTGLAGSRASGFLCVIIAGMLTVQVAGLTRRMGGSQTMAALAMALVVVLPAITPTVVWAYVDVFVTALTLATVRLLLDAKSPVHFVATGCYAGFLMGTKYTGIMTAAITICVFLIAAPVSLPYLARVRNMAIFAATGILIASPWYVRNFLQLGCPIYPPPPFLARYFSVRYLSPAAVAKFHQYIQHWMGGRLGRGPGQLAILPFRLSFQRWWLSDIWWGELGVVPLALAPLGVYLGRVHRRVRFLSIWTAVATLGWFFTEQDIRFLQAAVLLWVVFGVCAAAVVFRNGGRWSQAACALAVSASLLHGTQVATIHIEQVRELFDRKLAAQVHQEGIIRYSVTEYLNTHAEVGKVLIVDPFFHPFYLHRRYLQWEGENGERPLGTMSVAETIAHAGSLGLTHAFVSTDALSKLFGALPGGLMVPVYSDPDGTIYRLAGGS